MRLALGATPGSIVRLAFSRTAALVAFGICFGILLSLWTAQVLESLLYGVEGGDPTTLVMACAVMVATAVAASIVPACRAAATDPAVVLRTE